MKTFSIGVLAVVVAGALGTKWQVFEDDFANTDSYGSPTTEGRRPAVSRRPTAQDFFRKVSGEDDTNFQLTKSPNTNTG